MTQCYPHSKEGNTHAYSNQLTYLETIFCCDFLGSFAIDAVVLQLRTFHID